MEYSKKEHEGLKDILFDSETNIIKLRNENGHILVFELVFSCEEGKQLYCLLHPIKSVNNLSEDAAIAFSVDKNTGVFKAVKDREIKDRIFEKYYEEL